VHECSKKCGTRLFRNKGSASATSECLMSRADLMVLDTRTYFCRRRFWSLVAIIAALHTYNNYLDSIRPTEEALPAGALRRLPEGGLLMADGSIGKEEGGAAAPHTLHRVKEVGENELILDRAVRKLKDAV